LASYSNVSTQNLLRNNMWSKSMLHVAYAFKNSILRGCFSMEKDFTLDDFKRIFFWEYIHRMSGRGIAVLFVLPALYFLRKGWIVKPMKPRLVIYAMLLASQVIGPYIFVCVFVQ